MSNKTDTTNWPVVEGLPNQPDERLRAHTYNKPPASNLDALNTALSIATSCLSCYTCPQGTGNSYLEADDNGKYASEVIDNITYLRLANFGSAAA